MLTGAAMMNLGLLSTAMSGLSRNARTVGRQSSRRFVVSGLGNRLPLDFKCPSVSARTHRTGFRASWGTPCLTNTPTGGAPTG